jgi:hypothetical protein
MRDADVLIVRRGWSHERGGPEMTLSEAEEPKLSPAIAAQWEFAQDVARLIEHAHALGLALTFGEVWRPPEMQEVYLRQGKSWTPNSRHLVRRAVDFNLFVGGKLTTDEEAYAPLGEFWESLRPSKNVWGAGASRPRRDANHFERRDL